MATGGDKPPSLDADVDMADLASLDAPAAPSAAAAGAPRFRPKAKGKLKPKPEAPKPKPVATPKPEPVSVPEPEPEPEAVPAPPPQDDRVDAMEVDGAGDVAALGEGAAAAEEEEDFVVREIDVYFTPKPFDDDTKLYIMQYPLRPCWRPYELDEICEEVRVKPLSSEVEVDLSVNLSVNTQSENYDQDAPLRLTKQTLSSSKADDVSDYAVGVLKGNLVHLNHIDAVVQLRPSMSHVISGRAYTRQALQSRETNGGASGSKAPSHKGDDRLEDSKDQTEDSEPWISLTYQPAGSNTATKYHDKMISNEGGPIDFAMSNSDYVMSLCPGASTSGRRINKCQAIREMLLLPLEERLKKWFTEVSEVNQFDALKHLAPTYSDEEIFKVLPEYAYLVRGLWVCKSSLLFDDGYASRRDRVLLEFTKTDSIPFGTLDKWIKPDDLRRRRILFPLCKRRGILRDYKFLSADLSFLKRYPHIVNEQECAWSACEMTICESLKMCSTVAPKTKNSTKPNVASKGPHPNMSTGRDGPAQGNDDLALSVLGTVFTANKVRSMQAVVRDLRQLAAKYASDRKDVAKLQALSNAAKECASLPHDDLRTSICVVAAPVHDVFVAKHETRTNIRNVLIHLFRQKEANATLTKQEIHAAAVKYMKREMTEKEYHQLTDELQNTRLQSEFGHDFVWGEPQISYAKALMEPPRSSTLPSRSSEGKAGPQQVLDSLFKIPEMRTYEPSSMDWKKVVKKLQSFNSTVALSNQERPKNGNGYREFRGVAERHYDTMKEYYQKAALAYSKGDKSYAAYLAEEGKHYRELARMEDEKASRNIFEARNKHITNTVTIDLHGQHVQQAMRLLKVHMMICVCMPSVLLRVITGCGSEGTGKGKIKRTVIELAEKEQIEWREENSGTIALRLGGPREYRFLEYDSDSD